MCFIWPRHLQLSYHESGNRLIELVVLFYKQKYRISSIINRNKVLGVCTFVYGFNTNQREQCGLVIMPVEKVRRWTVRPWLNRVTNKVHATMQAHWPVHCIINVWFTLIYQLLLVAQNVWQHERKSMDTGNFLSSDFVGNSVHDSLSDLILDFETWILDTRKLNLFSKIWFSKV